MSNHISIHKAEFHNVFYLNSEENEDLLDVILSTGTFIYPLKDKGSYYLYDIENEKLLSKHANVREFILPENIEIVSFTGVSVEDTIQINIPNAINTLIFEGGDLMSLQMGQTKQGDALWKKVINFINLYKFVTTVEERLVIENELRHIYNHKVQDNVPDFGLSKLIEWVDESNITELTIGWTYVSDSDFNLLSKLKQLENLSIMYCYNDNIKCLPKNLVTLKIFGTTIQNLSEINLNLPHIISLDLEGNTINSLDNLVELPSGLEDLILSKNLIQNFNISELPKKLEGLDLSHNLINNEFFDQNSVHENLKVLILSENPLVITSSILHAILERFPNLEYLELLGNKTDGVPVEFLGNTEAKNCLPNVQFFLEDIDYKHNGNELIVPSSNTLTDYVEVVWTQELLPLKVILSDLQYVFSTYFIKMPSFVQYQNGLSCMVDHDNCEIFIKLNEVNKEVLFRVQSNKPETVALYFYKYINEVNRLIALNSHLNIIPSIESSDSCEFLNEFHSKVFKLDYKIKKKPVLKLSGTNIEVLINNRTIEEKENRDEEAFGIQGKQVGVEYENINAIAFVIVSGKSAYPFVINKSNVINALYLDKGREDYYYLILRTALEKETYINGITSEYLNSSRLEEVAVFIDDNIKKKVSCFINTNFFHAKDNTLTALDSKFPILAEAYLKEIKMDNGKYCEFRITDRSIELKYVI